MLLWSSHTHSPAHAPAGRLMIFYVVCRSRWLVCLCVHPRMLTLLCVTAGWPFSPRSEMFTVLVCEFPVCTCLWSTTHIPVFPLPLYKRGRPGDTPCHPLKVRLVSFSFIFYAAADQNRNRWTTCPFIKLTERHHVIRPIYTRASFVSLHGRTSTVLLCSPCDVWWSSTNAATNLFKSSSILRN